MGFHGHVLAAGSRGSSIFVSTRDGPKATFILQFRALDQGAPVPRTESPLSTVTDVQILFCPWCGANLEKCYEKSFRELDKTELQVPV